MKDFLEQDELRAVWLCRASVWQSHYASRLATARHAAHRRGLAITHEASLNLTLNQV